MSACEPGTGWVYCNHRGYPTVCTCTCTCREQSHCPARERAS